HGREPFRFATADEFSNALAVLHMQRCLMFTSKAMGQGGAPCALQIGHDRGQWRCMKQSKGISILVAIPFP
ncbi:MAG: hypothetical protein PWK00_07960, partial [Coxiella burnetii]|nr:hypothetical protein [Coxiella burnetii]